MHCPFKTGRLQDLTDDALTLAAAEAAAWLGVAGGRGREGAGTQMAHVRLPASSLVWFLLLDGPLWSVIL